MEQETKKINRKLKRLIIGSLLSLVSLVIGVVSGMKIAKLTNVEHNQTKFDQLIDVLNWMCFVHYFQIYSIVSDLLHNDFSPLWTQFGAVILQDSRASPAQQARGKRRSQRSGCCFRLLPETK